MKESFRTLRQNRLIFKIQFMKTVLNILCSVASQLSLSCFKDLGIFELETSFKRYVKSHGTHFCIVNMRRVEWRKKWKANFASSFYS